MIKIILIGILAFGLTACASDKSNEDKNLSTENKVEQKVETKQNQSNKTVASTEAVKEVKQNTTSEKVATSTQASQTNTKNIFELTTIDGKTLHVDEIENGIIFQEYKDKVVFLIFFGHRCPPCLGEIPALEKLKKEKGDKLEIIAMEVQGLPEEQLKIFKENKKINYTVLSAEHKGGQEFISYIAERAQWRGSIPFLVAMTPKGEVGFVHLGGMRYNQLDNIFNQLSK